MGLLRPPSVQLVVDIRSVPRSRRNPQYNHDVLPDELGRFQIGYLRIAELGGLRRRSTDVSPEVNGFWTNQSFHNYADYALTEGFRAGLERLLEVSASLRTAIMCAEAVWWRCHRRIVADYLLNEERPVHHVMPNGRIQPACRTKAARACGRTIIYPPG